MDEVEKISKLWDYVAEKIGEDKATGFLASKGFDNPHITKNYTLEKLKQLTDKILSFRKILMEED